MSGTTWTKFYWADWESDPALRLCSLGAQGLWMRMLCIAASHDPIGYVCVAGRPLGVTDLARLTGASETELDALFAELDRNGVFSRDARLRVYSRRMVRDQRVAAMARKNGKLGGNPNLSKQRGNRPLDNPPDKARLKPHKPLASSKVEEPSRGSSNLTRRDAPLSLPEGEAAIPPLRLVRDETPAEELAAWIEALGKSDAGLIVNRHKPEMLSEIEEFRDFAHARIAELQPQEAVA